MIEEARMGMTSVGSQVAGAEVIQLEISRTSMSGLMWYSKSDFLTFSVNLHRPVSGLILVL